MFQLPTGDVYQLHIRLAYIEPPIWRRIVVSGQISLFRLHRMLQVCEILVILNTRKCVPGRDLILIQSYFHCKRSTQPWLFFESRFLINAQEYFANTRF